MKYALLGLLVLAGCTPTNTLDSKSTSASSGSNGATSSVGAAGSWTITANGTSSSSGSGSGSGTGSGSGSGTGSGSGSGAGSGSSATPTPTATPSSTTSQPTPTATPYVPSGGTMVPATGIKASAIPTSEEILQSMVSSLGTTAPSTATYTAYNSARPIFSEDGASESITAPMVMNMVNLSGEVCNDLISSESKLASAQRRMFPMWDFTKGPSSLTAAALNDSIRRFARQVWARNETTNEQQLISSAITSTFTGASTSDTSGAAMMLCTATMSSLKGVQR